MEITCTVAATQDELDQVYRIRYECYRRRGSIPEAPAQRFRDSYDDLPNHFSFLLRKPAEPGLATVRISVVKPWERWNIAPVHKVFGDHEAMPAITRDGFVEASRLCFGELAQREILFRLMANMAAMADLHQVRWLVACPREEQAPMYQRWFGFKPLGEPRQYFGVSFATPLLAVEREELRRVVSEVRPMREAWRQAALALAA
jgi:hypothetical protein